MDFHFTLFASCLSFSNPFFRAAFTAQSPQIHHALLCWSGHSHKTKNRVERKRTRLKGAHKRTRRRRYVTMPEMYSLQGTCTRNKINTLRSKYPFLRSFDPTGAVRPMTTQSCLFAIIIPHVHSLDMVSHIFRKLPLLLLAGCFSVCFVRFLFFCVLCVCVCRLRSVRFTLISLNYCVRVRVRPVCSTVNTPQTHSQCGNIKRFCFRFLVIFYAVFMRFKVASDSRLQ